MILIDIEYCVSVINCNHLTTLARIYFLKETIKNDIKSTTENVIVRNIYYK